MRNNFISFIIIIIILIQNIVAKNDFFIDKSKYPNCKNIKGLQPDFQSIEQIIANEVHSVSINFVLSQCKPTLKKKVNVHLTNTITMVYATNQFKKF